MVKVVRCREAKKKELNGRILTPPPFFPLTLALSPSAGGRGRISIRTLVASGFPLSPFEGERAGVRGFGVFRWRCQDALFPDGCILTPPPFFPPNPDLLPLGGGEGRGEGFLAFS